MKCGAFREHLCCVNAIQYPSRVFLVRLIRNKRNSRKMLLCLKRRLLIFSNQLLSHCQSPLSRRSRRPLQNVKHLLIKREAKHAGDESLWSVEKKQNTSFDCSWFSAGSSNCCCLFSLRSVPVSSCRRSEKNQSPEGQLRLASNIQY